MMEESARRRHATRVVMDALASTRTAVVLLVLVAAASVVGTILPDPVAQKYVYGRMWFHVLLGVLGLNLVACMVWRRRIGLARIWSLLTHGGILLVLAGAMVTLVWAERGMLMLYEGQTLDAYVPEGLKGRGRATFRAATKVLTDPSARFMTGGVSAGDFVAYGHRKWEVASVTDESNLVLTEGYRADVTSAQEYHIEGRPVPLGFAVRLLDFRVTHYPPRDYLHVMRAEGEPVRLRIRPGEPLAIPGTKWRLAAARFLPEEDEGLIEVTAPHGAGRLLPAEIGSEHKLADGATLRVLRYEPSFKIDLATKRVTSDSALPLNPAVRVVLVREGKEARPRWLFAKAAQWGEDDAHKRRKAEVKLRYLHPAWPSLVAELQGPSGTRELRVENGTSVHSPWGAGLMLGYTRDPSRIKEYESEVEVLEGGRVERRHVIRVNSPLVYKGTMLSQSTYDQQGLRWTGLGVSRDSGTWVVYAGFLAGVLGVMGRFYVGPLVRGLRRGRATKEG